MTSSNKKDTYDFSKTYAEEPLAPFTERSRADFKTEPLLERENEKIIEIRGSLPTDPREVLLNQNITESTGPTTCKSILPKNDLVCAYTFKITLGLITILMIVIMKTLAVPDNNVPNVVDNLMNLFEPVNRSLREGGFFPKFMEMTSSLLMDISFIAIAVYWVMYGKNSRPIITAILFYTYRAVLLSLFTFPYPDNYYWEYPGMPSLIVVYGPHSDFFPSGQIGYLVIAALEWYNFGKKKIAGLYLLLGLLISFVFMSFRTSYSIDIIAAAIVAHWLTILVSKFYQNVDELLWNLSIKISIKRSEDIELAFPLTDFKKRELL